MPREVDPYMDAGMRGWLVNTARINAWRVAEWIELSDLIQDGQVCYQKCHNRYKFLTVKRHPSQDDKRRFMALVQTAFKNHITTLAQKRTALHERPVSQHIGAMDVESEYFTRVMPPQPEEASFAVALADAPEEIKALLRFLLKEDTRNLEFARTRIRRLQLSTGDRVKIGRRAIRETTNEFYCRHLGLDPELIDLPQLVRDYFSPSGPAYV